MSVIEPAAVASKFVDNVSRAAAGGPYSELLNAYLSRTSGAFATAQTSESAGGAIAVAVLSQEYRFRWQSSEAATNFAGVSLSDLDGERVLGFTRPWIAS